MNILVFICCLFLARRNECDISKITYALLVLFMKHCLSSYDYSLYNLPINSSQFCFFETMTPFRIASCLLVCLLWASRCDEMFTRQCTSSQSSNHCVPLLLKPAVGLAAVSSAALSRALIANYRLVRLSYTAAAEQGDILLLFLRLFQCWRA